MFASGLRRSRVIAGRVRIEVTHVLVPFPEQSGSPHGHRQAEPGEALFGSTRQAP